MKMNGLFALVAIGAFVSSAMASDKVCFGSNSNDEVRGVVMTADITLNDITLKTIKSNGDFRYNGKYKSLNSTVKGRDGKTYLKYDGEYNDYRDVILVDQELLKQGTRGLLQIRARGEGFFNSAFVCRDDRK